MIGCIRGTLLEIAEGRILVGVGTESFVGYTLSVPKSSRYVSLTTNTTSLFYIHTHVREDAFLLYGFLSTFEKEVFETLLGVSGIGPKMALSVLSSVDPEVLISILMDSDIAALTRVPGVGKKTAERMVLELSDKIKKKFDYSKTSGMSSSIPSQVVRASRGMEDARTALRSLGFQEKEIEARLAFAVQNGPKEAPLEEVIRGALRWKSTEL